MWAFCLCLWAGSAGEVPAADAALPLAGGYAVVVSTQTFQDAEWRKVVDALAQKHSAKVLRFDSKVNDSLPALKEQCPRYACFVLRPEEAGRDAVVAIHRLTRKLDDDPYTDVVWGIVTGYTAGDAMRIASTSKPLVLRKGAAGTGLDLNLFEEGRWYNEGVAGEYWEKLPGGRGEKKSGPADSTKALVDTLNEFQPDFFMTSGHATERDWQAGYSYRNGQFRCRDGKLFGMDLQKKEHPIASPNPKVFLGAGNCLIGHIPDKQCMALAWLGSGGATQFVGYTVATWYGAMGWGTKDYLFDLPGRYSLNEAFFFANQTIVRQLETRFAGKPRVELDRWDMERDRNLLGGYAAKLGYKGNEKEAKDHLGLLWDRDTVALYGDPAWEARLAPRELPLTTELRVSDGTYTFAIHAQRGAKPGKPLAMLLPQRVKNVELVKGTEYEPLITDDFIMLLKPGAFTEGREAEVVFRAQPVGVAGR